MSAVARRFCDSAAILECPIIPPNLVCLIIQLSSALLFQDMMESPRSGVVEWEDPENPLFGGSFQKIMRRSLLSKSQVCSQDSLGCSVLHGSRLQMLAKSQKAPWAFAFLRILDNSSCHIVNGGDFFISPCQSDDCSLIWVGVTSTHFFRYFKTKGFWTDGSEGERALGKSLFLMCTTLDGSENLAGLGCYHSKSHSIETTCKERKLSIHRWWFGDILLTVFTLKLWASRKETDRRLSCLRQIQGCLGHPETWRRSRDKLVSESMWLSRL